MTLLIDKKPKILSEEWLKAELRTANAEQGNRAKVSLDYSCLIKIFISCSLISVIPY